MVPMIIITQRFRDKIIVIRWEEPYLLKVVVRKVNKKKFYHASRHTRHNFLLKSKIIISTNLLESWCQLNIVVSRKQEWSTEFQDEREM
jgi:hypothetical protein